MRIFLGIYGLGVAIAWVIVAQKPDYFGNVGFLVVGTLIGIYPAFLIEEFRRSREAKAVKLALFHELAKVVGGCCFDYESPWKKLIATEESIPVDRLRKFIPVTVVIYPAVAPQIGLLKFDQAQAVIEFYIAFAMWRRDAENVASDFGGRRQDIPGKQVAWVGERLRRTLLPGRRALAALAPDVPDAEGIERRAVPDADELFPKDHPNKGKTVRDRIDLVLPDGGSHAQLD